jgi:hypothetical protein
MIGQYSRPFDINETYEKESCISSKSFMWPEELFESISKVVFFVWKAWKLNHLQTLVAKIEMVACLRSRLINMAASQSHGLFSKPNLERQMRNRAHATQSTSTAHGGANSRPTLDFQMAKVNILFIKF